ncbi:MAG: T9SS type A sorting domain-containing protein [Bacteroidia bacterium]|jgi:hypothetical protein|nr:T9SS type A sorting domain-containing protein [Bacteroidia bacterium]
MKKLCTLLLVLLWLTFDVGAQTKLSQNFSSTTFPPTNWTLTGATALISRDAAVNGYAQPAPNGAVKSDNYSYNAPTIAQLTTQTFAASVAGDSLKFDVSHATYPPNYVDSLYIFAFDGTNFIQLRAWGSSQSIDTGITTVAAQNGGFTPTSAIEWRTKGIALPIGTTQIRFVFSSGYGNNLYIDNVFVGQPAPACTGTPTAGTGPSSILVCSGSATSIAFTGATEGQGTTYQWQQSLDNGVLDPWANVTGGSGATTVNYGTPNITFGRFYRLVVTCTNSTQTINSPSVFVGLDSFYNCYCAPSGGSCWNGSINNVSITNGTINNASTCASPFYSKYGIGIGTHDTLVQGETFQLNINVPNNNDVYGVWVDYNRNGVFETTEFTSITTASVSGNNSINLNVPFTASPGITGLRIRGAANWNTLNGGSPCSNISNGETEDYVIRIEPAPVCSGTPTAGTISNTVVPVCAGSSTSLIPTGLGVANGLAFRWEESDDNGVLDPWSNTANAGDTNVTFISPAITSGFSRYYRLRVTCTNSSLSSFTNAAFIYADSFYNCYCTTNLGGSCWNGSITNVSITGGTLNNSTGCNNGGPFYNRYAPNTNLIDTVLPGQTITLNITTPSSTDGYGVWIDFNRNGVFDATEFTSITSSSIAGVNSVAITIPSNAPLGRTGLRVRGTASWQTLGATNACSNFWNGETEDYQIQIDPAPSCTGTPNGGTLNTSIARCVGNVTTLIPSGTSLGTGIVYQWEESDDNGVLDPWANTSAADTNSTFTTPIITANFAKYYRLKTTCTASTLTGFSSSILVFADSFYNCYTTTGTNGSCWNGAINGVSITGGTLNNTTTCNFGGPYFNRYAPGANTLDTVQTGQAIQLNVNASNSGDMYAVWIDYNRNGSFDISEYTSITNSSLSGNNSVNIIIPFSAGTGYTGMRVRGTWNGNNMGASNANTSYWDGETEDYLILIEPAPSCTGTPTAGTLAATTTRCAGNVATLQPAGTSVANQLSFQWEESDDNGVLDPWANTSAADTNITFTTPIVTSVFQRYYRMKVTCNANTLSSYTNETFVKADTFFNCYATPGTNGSCWDGAITGVSITNGGLNNNSTCNFGGPYYTRYLPGVNLADTVQNGQLIQLNVTSNTPGSIYAVWIDYNRNGSFDAAEYTQVTSSAINGVNSVNISVPVSAGIGRTGMRVRGTWSGNTMGASDANTSYWDGETEDYAFYIEQAPSCTGTPSAGTLPANTLRCAGNTTTLTPTGVTIANQLAFQWEESDDNGVLDPWANTSANDTLNSFVTPIITSSFNKFYRLKVTCLASTLTSFSTVTRVRADSFYNCYSSPGANGSCWNGAINAVSITGGTINNTTSCTFGGPYYSAFAYANGTADTLLTAQNFQLNVTTNIANDHFAVWIDFNKNGAFEATEYTAITSNSIIGVNSVSLTIPPTMALGITKMRVRGTWSGNGMGAADASTSFWDGETEDYWLNIEQAPACSGTPNGGTLDTAYALCPSTGRALVVTGFSIASGISYQWEESDDNGVLDPWANTTAADTSTTLNVTVGVSGSKWYRLRATCLTSAQTAYSTATRVYVNSPLFCYCTSNLGGGCGGNDVTNVSITGTSLNNSSACSNSSSGAFTSYISNTPALNQTAFLVKGSTYPVAVTTSGNSIISVWIDFNGNGIYEATEWTQVATTSTSNTAASVNVTIPPTAVSGQVGMRIRSRASGNTNGATSACINFGSGEAEDYVVTLGTIAAAPTIQASAVTTPTVNPNSVIVNWVRGNGARCIVVAKPATATAVAPVNGFDYTASNSYGAGDAIATNQFVVYNGIGTTVTVFGLTNNTTYEFLVYEFNTGGSSYLVPGASSGNVTTPVRYVSFTGTKVNNDAVITWVTSSEINNRGFEVLRSVDGRNFTRVDFIRGAGNSNTIQRYNYVDKGIFGASNIVYYKLRQVDYDGKSAITETVIIRADQRNTELTTAYPNPFSTQLTIDITSNNISTATIEITDISGRTASILQVDLTEGANSIQINKVNELSKGVYFVKVIHEGETKVFKLVKE